MTTLTRLQTDFFYAARTFTNEGTVGGSGIGDFWMWLSTCPHITDAQYNAFVDEYNDWESAADAGTLIATLPNNGSLYIGGQPKRPRPIHK